MIGGKQRTGFTLIELLIVAAIFSLTALMGTTVFSNVQTTQRTIQGQQRVTTDGRYVLETIARSIRTGSVNYRYWSNSVVPSTLPSQISVSDQDGVIICYRKNAATIDVLTPATTLCAPVNSSTWTPITPPDVTVEQLTFFVTPSSDPFRAAPRQSTDCAVDVHDPVTDDILAGYDATLGSCVCRAGTASDCYSGLCTDTDENPATKSICTDPNVQPQVTIALTTSSTQGSVTSTRTSMQTTVVSRVYQR